MFLRSILKATTTAQRSASTASWTRSSTLPFQQQSASWLSTTTTTSDDTNKNGMYNKIAIIGAGKMSQAMLSPLVLNGMQPVQNISIFDVSTSAMKNVQKRFPGIQTAQSIADAAGDADLVILGVKPQNINKSFFEQFPTTIGEDATLLSILAGTQIEDLKPSKYPKIVRSMPNTPAQIGQGISVWSCTPNLSANDRSKVKEVLGTFGKALYVDDEKFVDMSTSISGSGPAYIFLLMEAMIDAGVHMGFSRETATTLCYHTLMGSTMYAMETGEHPAILKNMVTSPAGTTASAVYELENGKFRTVVNDAIWACYRRSLEMGGQNSEVGPGRSERQTVHHYYVPSGEMNSKDNDSDDDDESKSSSSKKK
mmetsp:Transcript_28320/g.79599  ORF Transcript_28320/g.79599 Transcript_28320/m.79599 type:complete len:368 (-) Transcript_28320:250-1353(-)